LKNEYENPAWKKQTNDQPFDAESWTVTFLDAEDCTGRGANLVPSYSCKRKGATVVQQNRDSMDCGIATVVMALYIATKASLPEDLKAGFFQYESNDLTVFRKFLAQSLLEGAFCSLPHDWSQVFKTRNTHLQLGSRVCSRYMDGQEWYRGIVTAVDNRDGCLTIVYDDNKTEEHIAADTNRVHLAPCESFNIDQRVKATWYKKNSVGDASNLWLGKVTSKRTASDSRCRGVKHTVYDIRYDDKRTRKGLYADEIVALSS